MSSNTDQHYHIVLKFPNKLPNKVEARGTERKPNKLLNEGSYLGGGNKTKPVSSTWALKGKKGGGGKKNQASAGSRYIH